MNFLYVTGISGIVLCVALVISGAVYQRSHDATTNNAMTAHLQAFETGFQVVVEGYDQWVDSDVPGKAAGIITADPATLGLLQGHLLTACQNEADTLAPGQLPGNRAICSLPDFKPADLGWNVAPYVSTADGSTKVAFFTAVKSGSARPDAVALIAALKPRLDSTMAIGIYDPDTLKITDPTTTASPLDDLPATLTSEMNPLSGPGSTVVAIIKEFA